MDQLFTVRFPQQNMYIRPGKGQARISKEQAAQIMVDSLSAFIRENIEYEDLDDKPEPIEPQFQPSFGEPDAAVPQQVEGHD